MTIVFCVSANIDCDNIKIIDKYCKSSKVINDKKKDLVIVAFTYMHIKNLVCQNNVLLISPRITVNENAIINLSCYDLPRIRSPNKDKEDFYGLPGFPGNPGYNLSLCTLEYDTKNAFISKGSQGTIGQKGNPPGRGGYGGLGGFLIVNNKIFKNGDQGDNAPDHQGKEYNTFGIQLPIENKFGLQVKVKDYKQIVYQGIIELHLEKYFKDNPTIGDFFGWSIK
jgi:hypothetical protein